MMGKSTRISVWLLLACIVLLIAIDGPQPALGAGEPTVLITGSNRGIGLGFAQAYAERGWRVLATCRKPDQATELRALAQKHPGVSIEALDVTDQGQIEALAAKLKDRPIDVLINNAGVAGNPHTQVLNAMDLAEYQRVLDVNTLGPLRVSEAFLDHLRAGAQRKIMTISTSEASFGQDRGPARIPFYRSSKAALNMLMLNYAKMAANEGIAVGLVNPGPVDTDMMRGVKMPKRSVEQAVAEVMTVIDELNVQNAGTFWNYDGTVLAW